MSKKSKRLALAGIIVALVAHPGRARGSEEDGAAIALGTGAVIPGGSKVDIGGRLLARAELLRHYEPGFDARGVPIDRRVTSFDLGVPSARLEGRFRSPGRFVTMNLEVELTDAPELRDAWLRVGARRLHGQVGQFKVPFSAVELEPRFSLPTASRGLVHEVLVERLEVAGRRPGATVTARTKKKRGWQATLGSFQGSILVEQEGTKRKAELFSEQSLRTQSLVGRVEYGFDDVSLGAGVEQRVGTPAVQRSERYFTGGLDLTLDTTYRGRGFRLWVEGLTGESWLEHSRKPTDDEDARFAAARLIAAVRFGGAEKRAPYLEPYGMVGVFDPDTVVAFDLLSEVALGVNVGLWRLARVGLEGGIEQVERNFPRAYGLGSNPNRWRALVQAGASF